MKRLLAAGSGDIFQISKAFRHDECGKQHNPEFTLLEWYRLNHDHHQLMDDVEQLIKSLIPLPLFTRFSYQQCWLKLIGIDPLSTNITDCQQLCQQYSVNFESEQEPTTLDDWLQVIMAFIIEPQLKQYKACFIYDFPAKQSALSRLSPNNPEVAERFELYINGVELANGFHELTDAAQQQQRFINNNAQRHKLNKPTMAIDPYFIDALRHGLPDCSGVALGLDRLLMIATDSTSIDQVLCYDWKRA